MGFYIQYRDRLCRSLKLNVSPASPFQRILSTLNAVQYYGCSLTTEQINYAVLELLNNSLRAHRDRGVDSPISLRFSMHSDGLHIAIRDRGGGFDPETLPYQLHQDPEEIDVHDAAFESYRQQHSYSRFGLGIYLAKKTFPRFSLSFVDHEGSRVSEHSKTVDGTVIELATTVGGEEDYPRQRRTTALENRSMYAS